MSVYDLYQSYLNQKGPAVVQPVQPSLDIVSLYPQNYQGDGDGYSVYTKDDSYSAHFEHTVAITENGPIVLTKAA